LWPTDGPEANWLFGTGTDTLATAGALLVGEARVLAFPVRSAKGAFAWVTCPLALRRFQRDSGRSLTIPDVDAEDQCYAGPGLCLGGADEKDRKVVLEEYCLAVIGESTAWEALADLSEDAVWQEIGKRFVVLSDEMFSYFVEHACEVVTRVRIEDETGTAVDGGLFNQEQVPSETLFYAVIAAQEEKRKSEDRQRKTAAEALAALGQKLQSEDVAGLIQVGGDETVGLGYCSVALKRGE